MNPTRLSLDPPSGPVHRPDTDRLAEGIAAARSSPRRRVVVPVQRSETAAVQRMLNVIQPDSYLRPHHHPRPQGVELVCVLQGQIGAFVFDDAGAVTDCFRLRPGPATGVLDIEPRVWHTFVALAPDTIVLEIKGGPYDRDLDKVFPDWAPAEGDPAAPAYQEALRRMLPLT